MAARQPGGDHAAWLLDGGADADDADDSPRLLARASFDGDDALALAFALTGPVGVTGLAPIPARAPPKAAADDEEDVAAFEGYHEPSAKRALYLLLALVTLGASLLLCKWSPRLRVLLSLSRCPLAEATYVRVTLRDGRSALERVELLAPPISRPAAAAAGGSAPAPWERLLDHRCHRYFYCPARGTFLPVPDVPRGFNARLCRASAALSRRAPPSGGFAAARRALSLVDAAAPRPSAAGAAFWGGPAGLALAWRRLRYGANAMDVPVKPLASMIFDEMWHPFYVFQYFSVIVWVVGDSYWSYAACIMAITWFSIVTGSLEAHKNAKRLAGIARFSCRVVALRRRDDDGTALGLGGGGGGAATSPSPSSGTVPLKWVDVPSEELVPGDVVAVGPGTLPCDLVLLRGEAIVDENMLTGESVPVRKVAFVAPEEEGGGGLMGGGGKGKEGAAALEEEEDEGGSSGGYSPDRSPACTLYGGTCVAQAKFGGGGGGGGLESGNGGDGAAAATTTHNPAALPSSDPSSLPDPGPDRALAVVVRTRFYSAKGSLLRSILHPKEHGEAFVGDSLRFIAVMLAACLLLFVWAAIALAMIGAPASRIVTRFFDMITIAVPPALPACLTIATVFSVGRLKERDVYVTSPGATTAAGQLDVVCFDKTGTLTQQGLELQSIVPVVVGGGFGGGVGAAAPAAASARFGAASADARMLPAALPPLLATCHGLARLQDGTIVGDPLDQKLFAASGWGLYDGAHHASRPHPPELMAAAASQGGAAVAAAAAAAAVAAAAAAAAAAEASGKPQPPTHVLLDEADLLAAAAAGQQMATESRAGSPELAPAALVAADDAGGGGATAAVDAVAAARPAAPTPPLALDPASIQSWAAPPGVAPTLDASHAVVRRFEFSAELQRNAVVVRVPAAAAAVGGGGGGALPPFAAAPSPSSPSSASPTLALYVKGSPEAIRALVDPASVPDDFDAVLAGFTREGLRVLALAVGELSSPVAAAALSAAAGGGGGGGGETTSDPAPSSSSSSRSSSVLSLVSRLPQRALEAAARPRLVGLAVMANPLRADSAAVIRRLRAAAVRCAMVTGDHVRTAVSVSHQCGILATERGVLLVDGTSAAEVAVAAAAAANAAPPSSSPPPRSPHPPPPAAPATTGTAADSFADLSRAAPTHPHVGQGLPALPPHRLSVLFPDGSTDDRADRSASIARALAGELEVAVTGAGFSRLLDHPDPALLDVVLRRGCVFARMSPDNKRDLMLLLGDGMRGGEDEEGGGGEAGGGGGTASPPHRPLGLHVGFCGDGANDCGALKAAHVGVSLCEAEASVAAPMTSRAQTVACMLAVIGEGRCALVASYSIFSFIIGYAMAQAFATNILYTHGLMMGNNQYMVQDLLYITVIAALMGRTRPRAWGGPGGGGGLASEKPPARVVSAPLLVATVAQLIVVAAFQVAALMLLRATPSFVPTKGTPDLKTIVAPETTVIYLASLAQFLVLALVFNRGAPHRQPLYTNVGMVVSLVLQLGFLLYQVFASDAFSTKIMQLWPREPPLGLSVRWMLVALIAVNLAAAFGADAASRPVVRAIARRKSARQAEEEDGEGGVGIGRRGCCGGLLGVFFASRRRERARPPSFSAGGGEAAPLSPAVVQQQQQQRQVSRSASGSSVLDLSAAATAPVAPSRLGLPPRPPSVAPAEPRGEELL